MELLNPVVKLLLVGRLAATGRGLLIHALGAVWHHGEGVMFVGPSGSGKSTLARLLRDRGVTVLCDECVVARGPAPLTSVFLIRHAQSNVVDNLERADPARLLVPQLFLPFWDERALGEAVTAAGLLLSETTTRRLGFAPFESIHAFLASQLPGPDARAV